MYPPWEALLSISMQTFPCLLVWNNNNNNDNNNNNNNNNNKNDLFGASLHGSFTSALYKLNHYNKY